MPTKSPSRAAISATGRASMDALPVVVASGGGTRSPPSRQVEPSQWWSNPAVAHPDRPRSGARQRHAAPPQRRVGWVTGELHGDVGVAVVLGDDVERIVVPGISTFQKPDGAGYGSRTLDWGRVSSRSIGTSVRRRTSTGSPTSTSDGETATTTTPAARTSAAVTKLPTTRPAPNRARTAVRPTVHRPFSPGSDSWLERVLPARRHRPPAAEQRLGPRWPRPADVRDPRSR